MEHHSSPLPPMLARNRPALIRIVGVLTGLAIILQAGAHVGIQTWLNARLFAAGTQGPPPTEVAPNVWASEVGTAVPSTAVNLESLVHTANHYELLAMAIAWTLAGAVAVVCLRLEQRPLVSTASRRPAFAVPVPVPVRC